MAIKELTTSRTSDWTIEGWSMELQYDCSWEEWNNGVDTTGKRIPRVGDWIGDHLTGTDPNKTMRCTHLHQSVLPGTDHCLVTSLFSSEHAQTAIKKQANQAESMSEELSVMMVEEPVDSYIDTSDTLRIWADDWANASDSNTGTPPVLTRLTPRDVFHVTAYSDKLYISRILDYVGSINSETAFLTEYFNATDSELIDDITTGYQDRYCWLLLGVVINRVRTRCWEYTFQFTYNVDGWNSQHGVSDLKLYPTIRMMGVFDGMIQKATKMSVLEIS